MDNMMMHEGLPLVWVWVVSFVSILIVMRALFVQPVAQTITKTSGSRQTRPGFLKFITSPWPQLVLRLVVVSLFLLVIYAGIVGTPIAERNFATVVTWNLWWGGLIILVFFAGTFWCGVCPWDSLAQWLVRRRLWRRGSEDSSLNLPVPVWLHNVWPAALLFIGFTWLELGFGVTTSPYATAMLALLMVVLATISLALYEPKAFCRYFCPIGRTLGVYSQLSPVELRPRDPNKCADCKTLECYHGSDEIEPCPTRLVMGRFKQNTYCTSCGNCVRSCPHQNVSWHARPMGSEIAFQARPHFDEAWFMLILLALTSFHGLTMMQFWDQFISQVARSLGDSGSLLWSFSLVMAVCMLIIIAWYALMAWLTSTIAVPGNEKKLFSRLAFVAVPLAFSYHLAHNLNHLMRESSGTSGVWTNPTGFGAQPFSMHEMHVRHMNPMIPDAWIHGLQAGLMLFGIYFAVEILRSRMREFYITGSVMPGRRLIPMLVFAAGIITLNIWLLMEPMEMRF